MSLSYTQVFGLGYEGYEFIKDQRHLTKSLSHITRILTLQTSQQQHNANHSLINVDFIAALLCLMIKVNSKDVIKYDKTVYLYLSYSRYYFNSYACPSLSSCSES